MNRPLVTMVLALCLTSWAPGRVLFLNHFDASLDADHSLYGEPKADAVQMQLSALAAGRSFQGVAPGRALDAGYSEPNAKAMVRYAPVNFDSRRGTIEMWVKTSYTAEAADTNRTDIHRKFLSVPLGKGGQDGEICLQYCNYGAMHYLPHISFQIAVRGKDGRFRNYNASVRLNPTEAGLGVVWKKDVWRHLVVTWMPTQVRIFIDGKLAADRTFEPPMDLPTITEPIVLGNSHKGGAPAGALIDDVRISDAVLYEELKAIPVPQAPLSSVEDAATLEAGGFGVIKEPDVRQYYCYQTDTPPTVDGRPDDAVWKKLPAISGFLTYTKTDEYASPQTEVKLCRDDKNIYLLARMWEADLSRLKVDAKPDPAGGDNRDVFADDHIEVLLGPKHQEFPNIQIGINILGAHSDILHESGRADQKWNGTHAIAVSRTPDSWFVEMAMPCRDLKATPAVGDVWGFRVGRDRRAGGTLALSGLNYASTGFQRPEQFARLIMGGPMPELKAVQEENQLNQEYLVKARAALANFACEARAQLAFGAEVPAEVKDRTGIPELERAVRKSLAQTDVVVRTAPKELSPISDWNAMQLRAQIDRAILEKLSYLLANAGSANVSLPPTDFRGIGRLNGVWYVASDQIAGAVEPKHGRIIAIWDRMTGDLIAVNSYFLYQAQTQTSDLSTDERLDQVRSVSADGTSLVMECVNPNLPGVVLRKKYFLEKVQGETRLLCRRLEITGSVPEKTLLKVTSRTLFDETYRQPSFYNRIFVIGTQGDTHAYWPASKITDRSIQRAWFISGEGRAQFALVNLTKGTGIGEYLYKENDAWVFPQALATSYWTPFGWDMGFCQLFIGDPAYKDKSYSAELRYHMFRGDHVKFHREYMSLPEYAAERTPASPRVAKIAGYAGIIPNTMMGDGPAAVKSREKTAGKEIQALWRPDELVLSAWATLDRRWPDFPVGDDEEIQQPHDNRPGVITYRTKAIEVKKTYDTLRKLNPNLLANTYDFIIDIYKEGKTIKEHPEFVRIGRDGKPAKAWYGQSYVNANYSRAYWDYVTEGLLRSGDYYGLDLCYLDFGVGMITPDWRTGHIATLGEQLGFIKRLQAELHKRNRMIWLNAFTGQPYVDVGYYEASIGSPQNWPDWYVPADRAMMCKLYELPGSVTVPLRWSCGEANRTAGDFNETPYLDRVLGAGLMVGPCNVQPVDKSFPAVGGGYDHTALTKYHIAVDHASFEIRGSQWADVGLQPAWWLDRVSPVEAYTLRVAGIYPSSILAASAAYMVNLTSHKTRVEDYTVSVDLETMGLDPAKRTFVWQYVRRDYAKYPKGNPPPANWNELFGSRACASSIPGKSRFEYVVPQLAPKRLCATVVTQTPGGFVSAAGIATQFILPSTLGGHITGSVDEQARRVSLSVKADKTAEVVAWWPKAWGTAQVQAADKAVVSTPVRFGDEQFVRFAVPVGSTTVNIAGSH